MHASDDNTVIVAYDGSAAAKQAVLEASRLFAPCRMLVVTVWEPGLAYTVPVVPQDATGMGPVIDPALAHELETTFHDRAEDVAREGAEIAASADCAAHPLAAADDGDVATTLLAAVDDHQAAVLVVGSRGLRGVRARLEGSTSKAVLKHAACPVLVVHANGRGD